MRTLYLLRHKPRENYSVLRLQDLLAAAPPSETAEVILLEEAAGSEAVFGVSTVSWGGRSSEVTVDDVLDRIFAAEKVLVL